MAQTSLFDGTMEVDSFSDKIAKRLQKDSEEINRALNDFLLEREAVSRAQAAAYAAYEAEVAALGVDGSVTSSAVITNSDDSVDHNVMRQMKLVNESDEKLELDEYAYDSFDQLDEELKERLSATSISTNSPNKSKKINPLFRLAPEKAPMPGFEEKAAMRMEMFSFLDNARIEEMQLELEYERIKNEVGGAEAERAAEELFAVQMRNSNTLKEMFVEYQPIAFGKAWGRDPDYLSMAEKLKAMVASNSDGAHLSIDEIVGKKKKKGKGKGRYSDTSESFDN